MTADTTREPEVADLRAEIARLVVAITDSWPGEQVLADRRELAHLTETAVRAVAAVRSERDRHAAEVAGLRAGEDTTPAEPGVYPTAGQLWHQLLEAGHDERLRLLNCLLNQKLEAVRCFERNHDGQIEDLKQELRERPTRQAFDEVCCSVELQRAALVTALRATHLGPAQPFNELVQQVREVVERDAMAGFDEKSVRLQCDALADALGMDRGAWAPLIEQVRRLAGGA